MTSRFGVLDILFDKGDTENLATLVGPFTDHCRYTTMEEGVEFLKDRCLSDSGLGFVTAYVQILLEILDCRST